MQRPHPSGEIARAHSRPPRPYRGNMSRRLPLPNWTLPESTQSFDKESGQVFTEFTATVENDEDRNWASRLSAPSSTIIRFAAQPRRREQKSRSTTGNPPNPKEIPRQKKGAPSLLDIAIGCAVDNAPGLTLEALKDIPIRHLNRMWKECGMRDLVTFDLWLIFQTLLKQGDKDAVKIPHLELTIWRPTSSLSTYTGPLTSPTFQFLTSLRITTEFALPQLVHISSIVNLGTLGIEYDKQSKRPSIVTDRLIRAWSDSARQKGSFLVLRILKLWYHRELTSKSLQYLNDFPALAVYDVQGCNFDFVPAQRQAREIGWEQTFTSDLPLFLQDTIPLKKQPLEMKKQYLNRMGKEKDRELTPAEALVRNDLSLQNLPWPKHENTSSITQDISENYCAMNFFDEIGLRRYNADLTNAWIKTGNEELIPEPFISPRVAVFHLGPTLLPSVQRNASMFSPGCRGTFGGTVAFVRFELPTESLTAIKEEEGVASSSAGISQRASSFSSSFSRPGVHKRQKLDDIFNSFSC